MDKCNHIHYKVWAELLIRSQVGEGGGGWGGGGGGGGGGVGVSCVELDCQYQNGTVFFSIGSLW